MDDFEYPRSDPVTHRLYHFFCFCLLYLGRTVNDFQDAEQVTHAVKHHGEVSEFILHDAVCRRLFGACLDHEMQFHDSPQTLLHLHSIGNSFFRFQTCVAQKIFSVRPQ